MMNIRNFIFTMAVMICIAACGAKNDTETPAQPEKPRYELLRQASWLVGSWQHQWPEVTIT